MPWHPLTGPDCQKGVGLSVSKPLGFRRVHALRDSLEVRELTDGLLVELIRRRLELALPFLPDLCIDAMAGDTATTRRVAPRWTICTPIGLSLVKPKLRFSQGVVSPTASADIGADYN
ncbi:MAG: hypothetical protein V3V07_08920, partial [candidate division NC10 bacterium]